MMSKNEYLQLFFLNTSVISVNALVVFKWNDIVLGLDWSLSVRALLSETEFCANAEETRNLKWHNAYGPKCNHG